MIEIRDVDFVAKDGVMGKILDNVSLKIRKGEFVVITGPNGSGKSTLAEIIMGIKNPSSGRIFLEKEVDKNEISQNPSVGRILTDYEDITELSITERAKRGLAFSFQQPVKFKGIRVYDLLNIANGAMMEKREAGEYLKKVGLEPEQYLMREVNEKLSGGELKRVEIASVLARDARVLIFDEPEAGIDLWSFENLTQIFKKLKTKRRTVVVISHQERILKIADKIVVLENGKIKTSGAAAVILPKITGAKNGTD